MNSNYNELTASQACSQFSTYLSKSLRNYKNINKDKDFLQLSTEYSRMLAYYSSENIEKTIFNMLKTNNDMIALFKGNKEKLKETMNDLINPNCRGRDFLEQVFGVYYFIEGDYKNTYEFKERKVISKINKNTKAKEIYNTGILDWNFVRKQFPDKLDYWKVKEANAWFVCFVEKCDYELDEIIVKQKNGFADKKATFLNLIDKVNEASLTAKNPFFKGRNNLFFNEADSGEVDVMLWNKKNQKVVGASATRDRGYKIEGNQFFRHMLRCYALKMKIERGILVKERNSQKKFIKNNNNIQDLVRSENFKKYSYVEDILRVEKHNILNDDVINEINNNNEFAKNLTFYRLLKSKTLKRNLTNNGLNISESEIATLGLFNNGIDFVFYGETLDKKQNANIRAGLNCLAYRDNFNRIGAFKMSRKASTILLNTIDKRFNGVDINESDVELQSQKYIIDTMKGSEDVNKMIELMSMFSTGNVQKDERACLFKASSILFKDINKELKTLLFNIETKNDFEIKKNTLDKSLEKGVKAFFNAGIKTEDIKYVKEFIQDKIKIQSFIKNLSRIKIPNSEVPMEYDELKSNAETTLFLHSSYKDKLEIKELKELLNKKDLNIDNKDQKPSIKKNKP